MRQLITATNLTMALLLSLIAGPALALEVNLGGGNSILGLIILILDIVAIIEIVQAKRPTGEKVLWVVVILLLPVIGLIIYYLLGRKK